MNIKRPLISVIMLTYNREQYIKRMSECILNQTFQDYEFIIVDNGSTDSSGKIAEEYAQKDSRVHVLHRERGNIGSGRNAGLDAARGDWITFVDDDDDCEPDFLAFLYTLAVENDADTVACGSWKCVNGQRSPNHIYLYQDKYVLDGKEATENFLQRRLYNAAPPTKLVKRALFQNIRFDEVGQFEDVSTTYKFFTLANRVAVQGIPKYTFYRHNSNNSETAINHTLIHDEQLLEYLTAFRERTEFITQRYNDLQALGRYSEWSYMISMVEKINRNQLVEKCRKSLSIMRSELQTHMNEFIHSKYIKAFEVEWMEQYILPYCIS